ncbi:MAG: hypothetical protein JJU45_12820 [Acidimicrobiia bacterium]|nr:hypothetical protein [Acidimicrobiia bacterium]
MVMPPVLRRVVAAVVLVAFVAAPGVSSAQSTAAFPADLVAPVATVPLDVEPALALTAVYPTPVLAGDDPTVAVRFRGPFEPPVEPWRVSVVIGDPGGEVLRASLVRIDGEDRGRLEFFDGQGFLDRGETEARFDPSGLVTLTVPAEQLPAGNGVRAEVVIGEPTETGSPPPDPADPEPADPDPADPDPADPDPADPDPAEPAPGERRSASPWFDRDALFGDGTPGWVPGGTLATVAADGAEPELVVDLGTAPVVAADGDRVVVRDEAVLPTEVAGVAVQAVVDVVHIAPDFADAATNTPVVELNREAGTVVLRGTQDPMAPDQSGDRSWLLGGTVEPGQPLDVELDLAGVLAALGRSTDTADVGLGVSRMVVLADERVLVAPGVLGARPWLDLAGDVGQSPATPPPDGAAQAPTTGTTDTSDVPLAAIAAVLAGLAVAGLLVLAVVRRRHAAAERSFAEEFESYEDTDDSAEPHGHRPTQVRPEEGAAAGGEAAGGEVTEETVGRHDRMAGGSTQADVPTAAAAPAGPSRRAQRAPAGVTIDAALVTDLVPVVPEPSTEVPAPTQAGWWDQPTGPLRDVPPPGPGDVVPTTHGDAGPPPGGDAGAGDGGPADDRHADSHDADPRRADDARHTDDRAAGADGADGRAEGGATSPPSVRHLEDVHAEVDELAERLRRLEES